MTGVQTCALPIWDRELLFAHRYALSPAVTPERFTAAGLHDAIAESIDLLASPAGLLLKSLLPRDPTGEIVALLSELDSGQRPADKGGVWASRDGRRALLVVQTRAAGSDTDAQEQAIAALRSAFAAAAMLAVCALGLRVRAYDHRGHGASGGPRMVAPTPDR